MNEWEQAFQLGPGLQRIAGQVLRALEHLDKEQLKQLLSRGWMTHDGMWFAEVLRHAGIETANKLNLAAIRGMSPIEARRMRRAFGIDPTNAELLEKFYVEALNLLIGDFMNFQWEWGNDSFKIRMARCFAHEGMEMLGCQRSYRSARLALTESE